MKRQRNFTYRWITGLLCLLLVLSSTSFLAEAASGATNAVDSVAIEYTKEMLADTCPDKDNGHWHTNACIGETCTEHEHTDACYYYEEPQCGFEENTGHVHGLDCMSHAHSDAENCFHTHTAACYHTHTAACFHTHTAACGTDPDWTNCSYNVGDLDSDCPLYGSWMNQTGFPEGLDPTVYPAGERFLYCEYYAHEENDKFIICNKDDQINCGITEQGGHVHTQGCYYNWGTVNSVCPDPASTHIHGVDRHSYNCEAMTSGAHIHNENCFKDVDGDGKGDDLYARLMGEIKNGDADEIHLRLNGATLYVGNPYPDSQNFAEVYISEKHLIIEDGDTPGGSILFESDGSGLCGRLFTVDYGGSLTLNGSTVLAGGFTNWDQTSSYDAGGYYSGGGAVMVREGSSFTMNGGKIVHNTAKGDFGGGVYVDSGCTFTMTGGEICDNRSSGEMFWNSNGYWVQSGAGGGGVAVKGTFIMNGGKITDNKCGDIYGGGGVVCFEGTIEMNDGEISQNKSDCSGGGVAVYDGGSFTMSDGKITENTAESYRFVPGLNGVPQGAGGGVYVTSGFDYYNWREMISSFTVEGDAEISRNTAGEGGGIFIAALRDGSGQRSTFNMNGGTIDSNVATLGEGGGLYMMGIGEIRKGNITNNETKDTTDLGGGGIYVENTGRLQLWHTIISDNYAKGNGGGMAACVHGLTFVYFNRGSIIYNNTSDGDHFSTGYLDDTLQTKVNQDPPVGDMSGIAVDHHHIWLHNQDFIEASADIFSSGDAHAESALGGTGAIYVSRRTLGNGEAKWEGYKFDYNEVGVLERDGDGKPMYSPINEDGEYVYSGMLLGITAHPSDNDIQLANGIVDQEGGVRITGNRSATHGGGIGNNGILTLGLNEGTLSFQKQVIGSAEHKEREFTFRIDLNNEAVDDVFQLSGDREIEFIDGVAEIVLKDKETVSISGLPASLHYTVTEIRDNGDEFVIADSRNTTGTVSEGNVIPVRITNEFPPPPGTGSLTVSKTVSGSGGDQTKVFHFTVTLSDNTLTGTYGDMTFTDGKAEIELKHDESQTAFGLPAGITYEVTEQEANQDGYTTTASGDKGTIKEGERQVAAFENSKKQGDLTVSKTVSGSDGDKTKVFHFTVTLSDNTLSGTYGDMTFTDGKAEIELKHGESQTAVNLPAGITYEVTEQEANQDGYITTVSGDKGTIKEGEPQVAAFENRKELPPPPETGSLTVSKTVSGSGGDQTKVFHFTVTLSDNTLSGTYGDMTFTDGKAEIELKHGESQTAANLPAGITYEVTEQEANQDGYTTTASGDKGTIVAGGRLAAAFENSKDSSPPEPSDPLDPSKPQTGDNSSVGLWVTLMLASGGALIGTVAYSRKKKKSDNRQ